MRYLAIALLLALAACDPLTPSQKTAMEQTRAFYAQEVSAGRMTQAEMDARLATMKAQFETANDGNAMAGYAAIQTMNRRY